jgi:hypothetical protein
MLALKKKREADAKEAAAQQEQDSKMAVDSNAPAKVSLLGIGGKKKTKNGGDGAGGKKRTPGEIRIQKGKPIPKQ